VLVALVVAAGCRGDDDSDAAPRPPGTTSTVGSDPTSTSTPDPSCGRIDEPPEVTDLATATGDLDGDQQPDELSSYRDADGAWHLHVRLEAGGGADLVMPSSGDAGVQVVGGADVDGDGIDELWARTGAGASAAIVGLAQLVDCALVRTTFAGGEPAEFAVGGTVGTAAGLECRADATRRMLTSYTATNTGEDRYEVVALDWVLEGTTLVSDATTTSTVATTDDLLVRASSFSCGGLVL
jgi:hypothetical protein